jgi:hypothetical protein
MPILTEDRIAHLGMVQDVVGRLAGESARMKQFALVALGALASAAEVTDSVLLAMVACILMIVLWLLDARYLVQERWYRRLYDEVRHGEGPTDFCMTPGKNIHSRDALLRTAFGWPVAPLYGTLLIVAAVLVTTVGL